jgi:predicted HD phosphohydrolase
VINLALSEDFFLIVNKSSNNWDCVRLEVQKFRYLQDINNLEYFERHSEQWLKLSDEQKNKLNSK